MSSILVIKVKCGDTLRRFSVVGNQRLELNMVQLREKIRKLFCLGVDGDDFTLTYTDTDGDTVTLVDDCDLDDVVFQKLNPVRIVVNLKSGQKGDSCDLVSGEHQTIEDVRAAIEELMKNVPEPFRGVMVKATRDLAAAVSGPLVADLLNSESKTRESFASQGSQTFSVEGTKVQARDIKGEIAYGSTSNKIIEMREEEMLADFRMFEAKATDFGVYAVPDVNSAPPPLPSKFLTTMASSRTCSDNSRKGNLLFSRCMEDKLSKLDNLFECPFSGTREDAMFHPSRRNPISLSGSHSQFVPVAPVFHTGVQCDICGVKPITGPRFISNVRYNYDLCDVCYQKSESKAKYVRVDTPLMYREVLKSFHHMQKIGGRGDKFSAVEPFKPIDGPCVHPSVNKVKLVPLVNKVKLNSRFISDVNVIDGTVMAPSVRFTKIWRMKNTGNVVWPMGTQLVCVGGDKFSDALSVNLEIPAFGLPVDSELNVAVDFVAPELPGEYVSYWKMSSPSGRKFGQRVWVVIQVDKPHGQLSGDFSRLNLNLNLNLNLPPSEQQT